MKYSYSLKNGFGNVIATFGEFPAGIVLKAQEYIQVFKDNKLYNALQTNDECCEWLEILHRETWKDKEDKMDKTNISIGSATMSAITSNNSNVKAGMWPIDSAPLTASQTGLSKDFKDIKSDLVLRKGNPGQAAQADRINPTYYKDIVPGLQYMEMMQYMLARFVGVEAHLMGQIYKYLMRMGGKDSDLQELSKVKWYVDFMVSYLKNGKQPIAIDDMKRLLAMESQF